MEYSHQGYTECWAIHFWEVVNILTSEWCWLFTIHNYILLCTRQSWLAQWRNMPDQSLKKRVWVFMCSHINWSLLKSLCKINHLYAVVQSLRHFQLFVTSWTAVPQASLSFISPRVCWNSYPLRQWCHPTTSFSATLFVSCPQSLAASESF